jgi:hypothetical protein
MTIAGGLHNRMENHQDVSEQQPYRRYGPKTRFFARLGFVGMLLLAPTILIWIAAAFPLVMGEYIFSVHLFNKYGGISENVVHTVLFDWEILKGANTLHTCEGFQSRHIF